MAGRLGRVVGLSSVCNSFPVHGLDDLACSWALGFHIGCARHRVVPRTLHCVDRARVSRRKKPLGVAVPKSANQD